MHKKRFGFKFRQKKNRKRYLKKVSISFFVLTFLSLSLFSIYSNITSILFSEDKIDIFENGLEDIAMYFQRYDKDVSDFVLQIDKISDSYFKGENVFITQSGTLDEVFDYIKNKKNYLTDLGFEDYSPIFDFVVEGLNYKDDIYDLLGKSGERNYIVILQNTAEKRPNGGFFGSFGFISIQSGLLKNIEVIDSYYPNRIAPDIKLQAPPWSWKFTPDKLIGFISANKFGFTNIDGRNIKNLYNHIFNNPKTYEKKQDVIDPDLFEHTFNKKVHGVLFLRSDIMAKLIPGLQYKLRERQFINANTDILKKKSHKLQVEGELEAGNLKPATNIDFSNKKEVYIDEINSFFKKNKLTMIKNMVKNFDIITSQKYFNIYLDIDNTNINRTGLVDFLSKNNLSNNYSSGSLYFWDSNNSYNKIDTFVSKKIGLYDKGGNLIATGINDIIEIQVKGCKGKVNLKPATCNFLQKGKYTIKIKYYLDVPEDYKKFIYSLEEKYGIKMEYRELGILGIKPAKHYVTGEEKYRATRASVYLPKNVKILNVIGDIDDHFKFDANFANGLYYEMKILKNKVEKGVRIDIEVE